MLSAEATLERLASWPISLIRERKSLSSAELHSMFGSAPLVVCDFYVTGAESGAVIAGGFRIDGVDNVDHHAPVASMRRQVSSANLAIDYVQAFGSVDGTRPVVIHHTDCDSVLSSGIVQGVLLPDLRFGRAAIAADHTGEENPIADLLQALEHRRNLALSFEALCRLMSGEPLPAEAAAALQQRMAEREIARTAVEEGAFRIQDGVAYATLDANLDLAFMPSLLPDAMLVMVARPNAAGPGAWKQKIRLGMAAPDGASLLDLGIERFDPNFGGRWNAGSNRRAGGSDHDPESYAVQLVAATAAWRAAAVDPRA